MGELLKALIAAASGKTLTADQRRSIGDLADAIDPWSGKTPSVAAINELRCKLGLKETGFNAT